MTPDVDKLLQALPPEASTDPDPRDSEAFAQMNQEIDKLASLTAESLPNWSRIEQLGSDYLQTQAKDYLVASWLAEAWTHRYELQGIANGLTLLAGITEHHWEQAIPPVKRLRGRRNAIAWWTDRVTQLLENQLEETITVELSETLIKAAKDLDELLALKDPDANSLLGLIGHLQRIPVEQPAAAAPTQESPTEVAATDATTSTPGDDGPAPISNEKPSTQNHATLAVPSTDGKIEINSLDDLTTYLRPVQDYVAHIGPALFDFDHTHPLSIQLTRFAARAHIGEMPPSTNGQTAISPPAIAIMDAFEKISSSKNAEGLIEFCESRVREYPFWIDLDYQSAKGCTALGPSGVRMRDTIIDLVLNFLNRLPGIEQYSFSDGTPFAKAETLAWIERCRQERLGQGPADAFGHTKQEASSLLSDGKPNEAIDVLHGFIIATRSQRDQFRARTMLVEISLDQIGYTNALALVQPLIEDCLRLNLDQWEPELASQAWQLSARAAHQILNSSDQAITSTVRERHQNALDQAIAHLAGIDFAVATHLSS